MLEMSECSILFACNKVSICQLTQKKSIQILEVFLVKTENGIASNLENFDEINNIVSIEPNFKRIGT